MAELATIESPLASKNATDVLNGDRKCYSEGTITFALAQVEETNLQLLAERRQELEEAMKDIMRDEKLDFIGLMVTDAVMEVSRLLLLAPKSIAQALPYKQIGENIYDMTGVLSRKKTAPPAKSRRNPGKRGIGGVESREKRVEGSAWLARVGAPRAAELPRDPK